MVWGLIRVALFSGSFLIGLTFWGPGRVSVNQSMPEQPVQMEQPQRHRDTEKISIRRSHMVFICVSVPLWLP
jgi:hypothetical protein